MPDFRRIKVVEVEIRDPLSCSLCENQKTGFRVAKDRQSLFTTTVDWLCDRNCWALVNDMSLIAPTARQRAADRIVEAAEKVRDRIETERKQEGKQHVPLGELFDGETLYVDVLVDPDWQLLCSIIENPQPHPQTFALTVPLKRRLRTIWEAIQAAEIVPDQK